MKCARRRSDEQDAATIVGAAGGAVAGNQSEKRSRGANETFRVIVRFDNGGTQTVAQSDISDLRTGDRVLVEGGWVYRYWRNFLDPDYATVIRDFSLDKRVMLMRLI